MGNGIMNNQELVQFYELITVSVEGSITSDQFSRLKRILHDDPQAMQLYAEYMAILTHLRACEGIEESQISEDSGLDMALWKALADSEKTAESIDIEKPRAISIPDDEAQAEVQKTQPKISKLSIYSLILSTAALFFLIVYAYLIPAASEPMVGKLTKIIDAKWKDASGQITPGCDLYAGPLSLARGYAEIYTNNGCQIILQAPVELDMESDSQLFLRKGRVTVTVKPDINHYIVRTSAASVVDFGTEFGVYVDEDNRTLTEVYDGQVELRSGSDPLRTDAVLKINKGQGGQADAEGRLRKKEKLSNIFVRSEEFDVKFTALKGSRYQQWLAYSYSLRRDPDLVLYYPFLNADELQDSIPNYAINTNKALNGIFGHTLGVSTFTSPSRASGRWPEKAALKFDRDQRNCVWVEESPALDLAGNISLAAWVCCPDSPKGGHLFSNRKDDRINYQFGCFSKEDPYYAEKLQFLRTGDGIEPGVYSSKLFRWRSDWTLLAVTHDGQTVRFYVNGELFEAIPFQSERNAVSGNKLFIGDVPTFGGRTFGYAAFQGLIDEMAIFKRVLTADEIRRMYEAGKP